MTLEQLRIFVAVAERQHVTEAARALNLAQSAASHAIASLEMQHDTKLFDRVGRHIEKWPAGSVASSHTCAVFAYFRYRRKALHVMRRRYFHLGSCVDGARLARTFLTLVQHWSGAVMCPAC